MVVMFVLTGSLVLQVTAAILAFRLVRITGRRTAWGLIAAALVLMAARRIIPLYRLLAGDPSILPDPINELIGLALSSFMALGMARISPLFTERKQIEEALLKEKTLADSTIDGLPGMFYLFDEQGRFLRWNKNVERVTQYPAEEISRMHPLDFFKGGMKRIIEQKIQEVWDKGEANTEAEITSKDGSVLPYYFTGIRVSINHTRCLLGTGTDIAERKKAEEALRYERNKVINILDSIEDGVYIVNRQYDIEYANPSIMREFGPIEGRKCYAYFQERDDACPWCKNEQVFRGETVRWEWYSPRNAKTYDLIATPLRDPDGGISKLEILRDITGRKRTEEAMQKANHAYRALSACNKAVARAVEESDVLKDVAQIVHRECGYRLVWIGLALRDEAKSVVPVAQAGYEDGYLETLRITWADNERGRGPTGTAIRTGNPVLNMDVVRNPLFAAWKEEAAARGYASSASIPLRSEEQVLGALNVYAAIPNAFTSEEIVLLQELADNLAFGLLSLRMRKEREFAGEALKKLNEQLEQRVQDRTIELERKNGELERMNRLFVGRELRMAELKETMRQLEQQVQDRVPRTPDKHQAA